MRFDTVVDGPGEHGEVINFDSNDPASADREPFVDHDIRFRIAVSP